MIFCKFDCSLVALINKIMLQEVIIYILLILASYYIGSRFYRSIKKKQACGKCILMEEAKKTVKSTS